MMNLLRALLPKKSPKAARRTERRFRPEVECLESRDTPSVTFGGGAVLPNVEVQALYYGSDWGSSSYATTRNNLDGFLHNIVNSSYMDMLGHAGYNVGRGSASAGAIDYTAIDKTSFLTDTQIRNALANDIGNGLLQRPDNNTLYVVYVEDNVAVQTNFGNSINNFLGYHQSVVQPINYSVAPGGNVSSLIRYAIVTYPGGSVPLSSGAVSNSQVSFLNTFDSMTDTTSHELAEAVTDPDPFSGWNDSSLSPGEIGDIVNQQTVYLNGYAVQREADQHDQPMTPQGATAKYRVNFYLTDDGNLYIHYPGGSYGVSFEVRSGVTALSDQGIDNQGRAMVDFIDNYGDAYEYHEGQQYPTYLAYGVRVAKADQGESFYLRNDGTVYEYRDWSTGKNAAGSQQIGGGSWSETTIDAGTDEYGVNVVASLNSGWRSGWGYYNNSLSEYSDTSGWRWVVQAGNVQSFSVGQQGLVAWVSTDYYRDAYIWTVYTGSNWLWDGVAQITAGTDSDGAALVDVLMSSGNVYQTRLNFNDGYGYGLYLIDSNVAQISKAVAGFLTDISWDHYEGYVVGNWGNSWTDLGSFVEMAS